MYTQLCGVHIEKGREALPVLNPVTGDVIDTVPGLTAEDIICRSRAAAEGRKSGLQSPRPT